MTDKQWIFWGYSLLGILAVWVIFLYYKLYRKSEKKDYVFNQLNEILNSSGDGYFCFLYNFRKRNVVEFCSRKLSILLGLTEEKIRWKNILERINPDECGILQDCLNKLVSNGQEFVLVVQDYLKIMSIQITGVRCCDIEGHLMADVLWVRLLNEKSEEHLENQKKELENKTHILSHVLNCFSYPIWIRDEDLILKYCNDAYAKGMDANTMDVIDFQKEFEVEKDRPLKFIALKALKENQIIKESRTILFSHQYQSVLVTEMPIEIDGKKFSMGTLTFNQKEKDLQNSLSKYISTHYQVLDKLSSGILILDVDGNIIYTNKAYRILWHIEDSYLNSKISYGDLLDYLRQKRILPETGDFIEYKHAELTLFSTLNHEVEQIIYLPTGKILKRTMQPYPFGGVMAVFHDVTDRVSLEQSFNEQIAMGQSILEHANQGLLVFNASGRLKMFNSKYKEIWEESDLFLKQEPTIFDILDRQKKQITDQEQVWDEIKQKIQILLDKSDEEKIEITCQNGKNVVMSSSYLPDGGLLLSYDLKNN